MDGVYHITRKKVYNKKICYITYMLFNILINIYDTARQAVSQAGRQAVRQPGSKVAR